MTNRILTFLVAFLAGICLLTPAAAKETKPEVLVHFMPWYSVQPDVFDAGSGSAAPEHSQWGWHWTKNYFNPNEFRWDGRRKIASHDYPLIGPYDSSDEKVLQCQVLQMKLAGVDGVIIDWYGTDEVNDYAPIHENTQALIGMIERAGMKFAICYEDRTVGPIAKKKGTAKAEEAGIAAAHLKWVEQNWFTRDSYLREDGRPVLLVFGPMHLKEDRWEKAAAGLQSDPVVYVLPHLRENTGADGIFAWPPVDGGKTLPPAEWKGKLEEFYGRSSDTTRVFPVAFPGFHDIYGQAGLHESYGRIDDRYGETFRETLDLAMEQPSPWIQVATWNDYGEGTVIEPTHANGYRHLEELQRRFGDGATPMDLRLPERLLRAERKAIVAGEPSGKLGEIAKLLFAGRYSGADELLRSVEPVPDTGTAVFPEGRGSGGYSLTANLLYRSGENLTDYEKTRCRLDVYHPAKGSGGAEKIPTVVWFHGGGISKGQRTIPLPLRNRGVIVVSANYRLSPDVTSPTYIEDAAAAVAWTFQNIGQFGGSPDSIFVSGHSAGGYLASMVGMDKQYLEAHGIDADRIAGLIPFSGHSITHFTIRKERGIGGKQAVVDELAPLFHVRKEAPPTLLITGDRELEIYGRYEETAYFWRMMQEVGHPDTTLAELDGFDHGGMPEPAFPLLLDFVKRISGR